MTHYRSSLSLPQFQSEFVDIAEDIRNAIVQIAGASTAIHEIKNLILKRNLPESLLTFANEDKLCILSDFNIVCRELEDYLKLHFYKLIHQDQVAARKWFIPFIETANVSLLSHHFKMIDIPPVFFYKGSN